MPKLINNGNTLLQREFPSAEHREITLAEVRHRLNRALFTARPTSSKAIKSNKAFNKYINVILYLVPGDLLGPRLCINFETCLQGCLFWSGHGGNYNTARGRVVKTLAYLIYPEAFRSRLKRDLINAKRAAAKQGKQLVLRLNGTTDLHPRAFGLEHDPEVVRYEYTKCVAFAIRKNSGIHYTYSHYGNVAESVWALESGINVSIVLEKGQPIPIWAVGYTQVNGDEHDLRFLDPVSVDGRGSIVLLTAKRGGFSKSDKRTKLSSMANGSHTAVA